jgi:hypothetical protein
MIEIILQAKAFEQMVLINSSEVENYKDSFKHYLKEIVEVIEDLKSKGIYCYNSTVAEHCKHLNLDEKILSRFVYNSQSYLNNKNSFEQIENYKETYKDWQQPTEEKIKGLAKNKTYVTVVGLGKEPFKARPFFDAENSLFWLKPRYTRQGYKLNLTRYKE